MKRIIINYVYPPIPSSYLNWCACYDGEQEFGVYGWGRTEEEAIENLRGAA